MCSTTTVTSQFSNKNKRFDSHFAPHRELISFKEIDQLVSMWSTRYSYREYLEFARLIGLSGATTWN